jgi:hypothetical protein
VLASTVDVDSSSLEITMDVVLASTLTGLLADEEHELLRDSGDGEELEQLSSNFSTMVGKWISLEGDETFSCSGDGIEAESKEIFSSACGGLLVFANSTATASLGFNRLSSSIVWTGSSSSNTSVSSVFTGSGFLTGLIVATNSSLSSTIASSTVTDFIFSLLSSVTGTGSTSSVLLERIEVDGKSLSVIPLDGRVGNGDEMFGGQLGISSFKHSTGMCVGVDSSKNVIE